MFTGLVSTVGTVRAVAQGNDVRRLRIACSYEPQDLAIGASVACAGVCMTIVAYEPEPDGGALVDFDAAPETLRLTTAGAWQVGTRINLERPLRLGDELGGHMVAGHVDGLARIEAREDIGAAVRFDFVAPPRLARYVAPKGSVALDGTSLTVNSVDHDRFDCLLVPHTLQVTTWADRRPGDLINLEVDTVARYVARLMSVDTL
ncbi:MAG: riboflavin synthase [Alphaproteobacteria bacterium]